MGIISWQNYPSIVILTGAGVSVASGLPTYRGAGGLWENDDVARYALADTWRSDPLAVWKTFGALRASILDAQPNAAHRALAALEQRIDRDAELHLVTQNVDGLHQAAGSHDVIELHGSLRHTRCSNERCALPPFEDTRTHFDRVPVCPECHALQRPAIVLFGEPIDVADERRSRDALRECDLFVAVGTSGTVTPAANFVRSAKYEGAHTVFINAEPMEPPNPYFDEVILGPAEEILPDVVAGA